MIPAIDRAGPTPLYLKIKEWIKQQIEQGIWPEHYKLLSETDLASELDVSRGTVRKAITELIEEGMLVSIHGRGTFVASRRLEQPLAERLVAISEDLISKGIPFETQVITQSLIDPDERIASLLSISKADRVFFLKRVRYVGNTPLILLHNYVVYQETPGIEKIDFTRHRLFEILEDHFGLDLDWGKRTFEAQVADAETASLLGIMECDPVMYLEQIVFLKSGTPVEMSDVWLRGDRYRLSAIVKRDKANSSARMAVEYL
jgi:DNA-binding GntR family transcriptional regulator